MLYSTKIKNILTRKNGNYGGKEINYEETKEKTQPSHKMYKTRSAYYRKRRKLI